MNENEKHLLKIKDEMENVRELYIKGYIYFHLKLSNFKKLGWGFNELKILLNEFLKYKKYVIFTKDIENNDNIENYKNEFNIINFGLSIASRTTSLFTKILSLGEKTKSDFEKVKLPFEVGKFIFCH